MRVHEIVKNVSCLLDFQRDSLLADLNYVDDELDAELILRTFLDEFFHRVMNVSDIVGKLGANESAELDRLIEELTK